MDIVFIRHGRTEVNEKGIYGGFIDAPLSPAGIGEAAKAKEFIKGKAFDRVYLSPLKRAVQTAELLGFTDGCFDERLREMNFGIFEGLSYKDILERYPKEAEEWGRDYINYRIPKAESLKDLYDRVTDFLAGLSGDGPKLKQVKSRQETILVVTHEGVIKSALCSIFNNPEYFYRFKAAHCRFTQIAAEDGYAYLKSLNAREIY